MEKDKANVLHKVLEKEGVLENLLSKLEGHINEYKFKEEIDKYVRAQLVNKNLEEISANEIYDVLYEFVSENLPAPIQELMFHDIRKVVEENLEDLKDLS